MCQTKCCNLYFSEWKREASIKVLCIKGFIIIFLTFVLAFHSNLDTMIIDSSRITYKTLIATIIWSLLNGILFVIYVPTQHKIFPLWWKITISVIFLSVAAFFIVAFLWIDAFPNLPADTMPFDLWTIVHFLWGVWLSWLLPFIWMLLSVTTWEINEAFTKGLGESEGIGNHTVDTVVAIIGYFIVILIFSYKDIPWITGKRGVHCSSCKKYALSKSQQEKSISMIQAIEINDGNTDNDESGINSFPKAENEELLSE